MAEIIVCDVVGKVCTLTLNRPDKLNALNADSFRQIAAQLDRIDMGEIACVLLKGAGRSFCAGHDLDDLASGAEAGLIERLEAGVIERLATLPVPLVAAVQGHCYTGGLELVLAADIIIAAADAKFADTHAKWDLVPVWGLTQRLQRRVGRAKAMEMMFTSRAYSGEEALAMGLANLCVPADQLEAETKRLVGDILANSRRSNCAMKKLMADTDGLPLAAGLAWELYHSEGHGPEMQARIEAARGQGARR
ncbi:MAG TPA: enoyl-CoA hydratase/isomerase family protein [Rhizorhapis sp.]|nr:enoyl-CoA hydratase/isomerase family protein [Rhizorhapis sp.]